MDEDIAVEPPNDIGELIDKIVLLEKEKEDLIKTINDSKIYDVTIREHDIGVTIRINDKKLFLSAEILKSLLDSGRTDSFGITVLNKKLQDSIIDSGVDKKYRKKKR